MNYVSIGFGLIAVVYGLATFAQQLRPANRHKVRELKSQGNTAALATHISSAVAGTLTPIIIGITFVVLGLMGRALFPFSLFY